MKATTIRDKIVKSKLIDMLGRTMAEEIYNKALFAATSAQSDEQNLQIFVERTCSDPKFIGMWGKAQAARQKSEWLGLLS